MRAGKGETKMKRLVAVLFLASVSVFPAFAYSQAADMNSLIQNLKDKDATTRAEASKALGEVKDTRAVDPLIAALKDKDSNVRWRAAEALGKIKDPRAVEALIDALKDKDLIVRISAAESLGEIKDGRAAKPLVALLRDKQTQLRAILSLEEIGQPGERALMAVLENEDLETIASAYEIFIRKAIKGSGPLLIKTLYGYGGSKMAQDFLNSRNSELSEAAYEWAKARGIQVITLPGRGTEGPKWGERR
jgi:hypothetical protein